MSQHLTRHLADIDWRASYALSILDTTENRHALYGTVDFAYLRTELEKLSAHVQGLREESERSRRR